MDISRIVSVACVLLLSLCCLLSIYAVAVLRSALMESTEACFEVKAILETMEPEPVASTEDNDLSETDSDSSLPVDVLADHFCIRETNGRIAIYTADGYLIRLLERSAETLPHVDRLALQQGIYLSSWKEVLALMEDFGA